MQKKRKPPKVVGSSAVGLKKNRQKTKPQTKEKSNVNHCSLHCLAPVNIRPKFANFLLSSQDCLAGAEYKSEMLSRKGVISATS